VGEREGELESQSWRSKPREAFPPAVTDDFSIEREAFFVILEKATRLKVILESAHSLLSLLKPCIYRAAKPY